MITQVLETLQEYCEKSSAGRVHVEQWRDASLQKNISSSSDDSSKKKAFNRARKFLVKNDLVAYSDDWYWLVDNGTN